MPEPSSAALFGLAALGTILAARARRLPVPRAAG
ncbi:MAG: PEP-CTERM sorting domain-containing protein [Rhodospirillales bacterium]|nr:PEP-CTERM sorting domain-containing protein [Rhodospirillales bacterium]